VRDLNEFIYCITFINFCLKNDNVRWGPQLGVIRWDGERERNSLCPPSFAGTTVDY
jgi:hypothetical protein